LIVIGASRKLRRVYRDGLAVPRRARDASTTTGALREEREVVEIPEEEKAEISRIFQSYEVTEQEAGHVVEGLARNPKAWVDFMMKFELAWRSRIQSALSPAHPQLPLPISLGALFRFRPTC